MRMPVLALFALAVMAQAQNASSLHSGSMIYIEPMGGYEAYLAAALVKNHVPLVIVTDKTKAAYIVESTVSHSAPSTPAVVINNSATATVNEGDSPNQQAWNQGWAAGQEASARRAAAKAALGYSSASISIVDAKSSQIAFAYSAGKGGTNQLQKTAEDCAKHLKEFIEKSEKGKK